MIEQVVRWWKRTDERRQEMQCGSSGKLPLDLQGSVGEAFAMPMTSQE